MFTDTEPGADPRLAAVFSAAKAPAELPVPGEAAALAAYRRSAGRSWFAVRLGARPAQMLAAAIFGGFVVAGGVATAATGSLPIVGVHQHHATATHQDTVATDVSDLAGTETVSDTDVTDNGGPGTEGHTGVLGSVAKGVETCTEASHDTCQAGQHGKAMAAHDHQASGALPDAATQHRSTHAAAAGDAATVHRHITPLRPTAGPSHRRG